MNRRTALGNWLADIFLGRGLRPPPTRVAQAFLRRIKISNINTLETFRYASGAPIQAARECHCKTKSITAAGTMGSSNLRYRVLADSPDASRA
jgi:hypothetical protein